MDVEDVKDIGNNLPNNNITPPSNNGLTGEGLNSGKKPDELVPKGNGDLIVPENENTDVLDPEGEDVLDPENDGSNGAKKKKTSEDTEKVEQPGETEDVLDPEAEKEDKEKKEKKDDKKEDGEDSGDGTGDSSGDGGSDSSGGDTTSDLSSKGDGGSDLGSGSSGSDSGLGSGGSGSSGIDSGLGSGGGTPGGASELGAGGSPGGASLGGGTPPPTGGTPALTGGAEMGASTTAAGTTGASTTTAAASSSSAAGGGSAGIFANPYVLLAIVIIIVIIGLIGFILNMPGLLVGKLKQFAQDLWDGLQSMFTTSANAFINDEDVTKVAQYLVDMDYDLIGYGFVRANIEDDYDTFLDLEEDGYYLRESGRYSKIDSNGNETFYDGYYYSASGDLVDNATTNLVLEDDRFTKDKYGIRYWASDGTHGNNTSHTKGQIAEVYDGGGIMLSSGATADDSLLRSYLMADYRITVLRNDDEGLLEDFGNYLDQTFGGAPNAWSKGMIKLYKKDGTEVKNLWTGLSTVWWNDASIKDGTKLSIRNGWFNRPMEFQLDGWTGRYGLSLEFLLSLHLGTMAPDLVTAMLQCFDTEVQVYVEAIEDAQVVTKYKDYKVDTLEKELDDNNEEVTMESLNAIIEASDEDYWFSIQDGTLIEWVNELSLTKKKCQELLLKSGLSSPENCIYTAVDYVILHMQSHYNEDEWWPSGTATKNYLREDYDVSDPNVEEFEYRVKEDTDKYYTADNSLFSLRNDYKVGNGTDPNDQVVSTGIEEHVYPDREKAYNEAKSYGMKDSDIVAVTDTNFTQGAEKTTSNGEVIGHDNFVYRIEKDVQNAEWQMYGYLDGIEFKLVDEETFNNDTENKYEETTAYYHSYIYKIYQIGSYENGSVSYFRDNVGSDRGKLVYQFDYDTVDNKVVYVYYDENLETEHFEQKFVCYDENNEMIGDGNGLKYNNYIFKDDCASIQLHSRTETISSSLFYSAWNSYTYYLNVKIVDDMVHFELEESSYFYDTSGSPTLPISSTIDEISFDKNNITSIDNNTAITGDILYDVLYLNFAIRDKSLEELVQCGILKKEDGKYVPVGDPGKCSADKELTKCCTICQRYVKGVIRGLAQIQDTDYSYFQPYIARVVGSWFRDTYFIIPETEDGGLIDYYGEGKAPVGSYGSNGAYVKVDEEYLASSGEYWTDYEMKKDPDTGEETDAYQLYYLNPDGSTSNKKLEDWLLEEHYSKTTGENKIFTSQEEAEKEGYVFVKRAKLMSLSDVKDIASGEGGGRDLEEKPYMDGTLWSAYSYGDGTDTGWIKVNRGEVDNVDKVYDMVDDKGEFYYRLTSTKSIEQEEDAIRTETNVTVKNLFRYRQYYIYDGTRGKAEAIQADRLKVHDLITEFFADSSNNYSKGTAIAKVRDNGRYASRLLYNYDTWEGTVEDSQIAESWLEWQLDMYYRANNENGMSDAEKELFKLDELCEYGVTKTYTTPEGETEYYLDPDYYKSENHSLDPRDRNLISTVNITKSSLDAFSILENVNTLDADYQYRDFKELIVELNYFDKEDLSETVEEVFTWLVPTYTSTWPILGIDKQNNEYGTLLHSQESIDFLIKVYEKLVEEEKALAEANGTNDEVIDSSETSNADEDFDMSKVYYIGDSWFVALRDSGLTESENDYFTAVTGKRAGDSEFNNIQVKSDASAIVIMLGLNGATTQNEMKALLEDLSTRYNNKNIYVLKVFHVGRNYTNMDKDELNSLIDTYNQDIQAFCSTKDNLKFVDATEGILDEQGYIKPAIESADGMHLTSYGKLYDNIENAVKVGEGVGTAQTENEKILELLKDAEAYQEGDAVISPATGKILAYGEHERINVYTQEIEKVGYIKIEVMPYGEDFTDANKSYFTLGMMPSELTQEEKEEAVKGLNAFYKEYQDQCAGFILTIDGVDITDLKNGFTGLKNADGEDVEYEELCQYEKDEVVALYNSKEQKSKEAESEAKVNAPSFISYNADYRETNGEYFAQDELGGYYIKEGAYLGKVQESTTRTGEKADINKGAQKDNPNIENPEDLVEENPVKTVDKQKIYDQYLDPNKNPNYIRMILLDEEMTVVDNVEDYFPGPEYENGTGMAFQGSWTEKGMYWMIVGFEGMQMSEVTNGFVAIDIGDGTVTAGGSGITNWCNEYFWQLGYGEYMHNKRGSNVGMEVGDVIPGNVIMDVKAVVLEAHISNVQSTFPGNTFTQNQVEALASVSYNFGHIPDSLVNAINSNENLKEVWEHLSDSQAAEYPGLVTRRKAEYKLFSEGIYSTGGGEMVFATETPFTDYVNGTNTVTYK